MEFLIEWFEQLEYFELSRLDFVNSFPHVCYFRGERIEFAGARRGGIEFASDFLATLAQRSRLILEIVTLRDERVTLEFKIAELDDQILQRSVNFPQLDHCRQVLTVVTQLSDRAVKICQVSEGVEVLHGFSFAGSYARRSPPKKVRA